MVPSSAARAVWTRSTTRVLFGTVPSMGLGRTAPSRRTRTQRERAGDRSVGTRCAARRALRAGVRRRRRRTRPGRLGGANRTGAGRRTGLAARGVSSAAEPGDRRRLTPPLPDASCQFAHNLRYVILTGRTGHGRSAGSDSALLPRQRSHLGSWARPDVPSRFRGLDHTSRFSRSLRFSTGGPKTPQCRTLLRPK